MGFLELPDPHEPGRPERASADGADRPTPNQRELPDPDERGRLYEVMRAHASAETDGMPSDATATPQHDDKADRPGQGGYRDEVPRFMGILADHETRWAETRRHAAELPTEPATSSRPSGDLRPGQERQADTAEAIGRIREAEPGLSADAQAIEQENKHGGWLEGFRHRLKDEDRLKEKIAEQIEAEENQSAAEVLRRIPDVIRYTYCFEPESYTRGYYDIKERFESRGHEMYYSRNYWADPEYKGINTRWVTAEGQRFELQFHTPDSFHAKHRLVDRCCVPSLWRAAQAASAGAGQPGQLGQGLFGGQRRIVQMSRAGMWLTCQQFHVGCEPGRVAVWRAGAAGEHGREGGGQRDVIDLCDRAEAGEDRRCVIGVEQAVPADDDGLPAVLEQRDGQLGGLGEHHRVAGIVVGQLPAGVHVEGELVGVDGGGGMTPRGRHGPVPEPAGRRLARARRPRQQDTAPDRMSSHVVHHS